MKARIEHIPLARWSQTRVFRIKEKQGFKPNFHFHPEFEIVLLEKQPTTVYLNEETFDCDKASIVFIESNTMHTFSSRSTEKPTHAMAIQFAREALAGFDSCGWNPAASYGAAAMIYNTSQCPAAPESFTATPENYGCAENPEEGFMTHTALCNILTQLGRVRPLHIVRRTQHKETGAVSKEKLAKVLNFIHKRNSESISLTETAGIINMNPEPFCRFFKRHTGRTFTQYINDLRLSAAARALSETDTPIIDIAYDSGYENLSYFNRRFKRRFNTTPNKYRAQQQIPWQP